MDWIQRLSLLTSLQLLLLSLKYKFYGFKLKVLKPQFNSNIFSFEGALCFFSKDCAFHYSFAQWACHFIDNSLPTRR